MPTLRRPKVVKVHADGCSPANLELFKDKDTVIFVRSEPGAPAQVHLSSPALFGTATCAVGATAEEATPYPAQTPGNYTIGPSAGAAGQAGTKGTVQVLCLGISGAMGAGDSGTIKVNR